ncbi:substrate of the Dot/Icm system [Legionella moravica]|uniref:SidB n=2 Tax=Legionella moravica TaxID=39962 RepID=A0A378JXP6_9GAMM|nr:substrate of the Dot/Icm system [Legionella moravica]STX62807.1 SidB [Legionella moravica]
MRLTFNEFQAIYDHYQYNDTIVIRYSKEKNDQTIDKEIKLSREQNCFYFESVELNESKSSTKVTSEKQEITEQSLQKEHAFIATLFTTLKPRSAPKTSAWEDFKNADSKLKWLLRFFLLDTQLIGGAIGHVIAYSANSENKHYKTIPSSVLGKTLGPLIFPAGSKKPSFDREKALGIIEIDTIQHKQYKALKGYNPIYQSHNGTIRFSEKPVSMSLRNKMIALETIVASNEQVTAENEKNHLTIVYFNGNSGSFQQDYQQVAEDLLHYGKDGIPVTAIQFNYPGILNSEGQVDIAQDLIDSGIAQVQALLDQGVSHSNIVLHGVSLGGSIASHVAAHFHQLPKMDDPKQKQTLGGLYASRTFASTAQVGRDYFNRALGNNIFSRIFSTLCLPFIKLGTWGSNWDLDTGKAFFSLPKEKRNYSVVISPKAHRNEYRKKHQGSWLQQIIDFLLDRENNPVDDAVLGRGLHDSWERSFDKFLVQWGFYGEKARSNYSAENSYRKMMVVDFKTNEFAPDLDGHAIADYCYKQGEQLFNPTKVNKSIGLVHRAPSVTLFKEGINQRFLPIQEGHEAGEVARRSMLSMSMASSD